jgi:hypothetical protein
MRGVKTMNNLNIDITQNPPSIKEIEKARNEAQAEKDEAVINKKSLAKNVNISFFIIAVLIGSLLIIENFESFMVSAVCTFSLMLYFYVVVVVNKNINDKNTDLERFYDLFSIIMVVACFLMVACFIALAEGHYLQSLLAIVSVFCCRYVFIKYVKYNDSIRYNHYCLDDLTDLDPEKNTDECINYKELIEKDSIIQEYQLKIAQQGRKPIMLEYNKACNWNSGSKRKETLKQAKLACDEMAIFKQTEEQ